MNEIRAIRAGWVMDGSGARAQGGMLIVMDQGRIAAVLRDDAGAAPPMAPILDCRSCTVIPGLVDAHVHLAMSGNPDPAAREKQLFAPYHEAAPVIEKHLASHLECGVTAVRDGGDWGGHALAWKKSHPNHLVTAQCAGRAWRAPGRYGKLVGRPPEPGQSLAQAIAANADASDFIKVVGSGLNSLLEFAKETPPQFSLEDLTLAVAAAAKLGLSVMVHANGGPPVQVAVEAGCASVEHGFFMGRDNLERLARSGTVWAPTAVTMESYAQSLPPGAPEAAGALRNLEHQVQQMSLARELGVAVACGTDAGSTGVHHGSSLAREMALLVRAGYSVEEAVQAATHTGARLLGLEGRGLIAPGQEATLVIVKSKPGGVLESLHRPLGVLVKGRMVSGSAL